MILNVKALEVVQHKICKLFQDLSKIFVVLRHKGATLRWCELKVNCNLFFGRFKLFQNMNMLFSVF